MNNVLLFTTNYLPYRIQTLLVDDYHTQCMTMITLSSLVTMAYFLCSGMFSTLYYTMMVLSSCRLSDEDYSDEEEEKDEENDEEKDEEDQELLENRYYDNFPARYVVDPGNAKFLIRTEYDSSESFSSDEDSSDFFTDNEDNIPEGFYCVDCEQLTCPHCKSTQTREIDMAHKIDMLRNFIKKRN